MDDRHRAGLRGPLAGRTAAAAWRAPRGRVDRRRRAGEGCEHGDDALRRAGDDGRRDHRRPDGVRRPGRRPPAAARPRWGRAANRRRRRGAAARRAGDGEPQRARLRRGPGGRPSGDRDDRQPARLVAGRCDGFGAQRAGRSGADLITRSRRRRPPVRPRRDRRQPAQVVAWREAHRSPAGEGQGIGQRAARRAPRGSGLPPTNRARRTARGRR